MDETPVPQEVLDEVKAAETKAEVKKDAVEEMVVETFEPKKNCRKCHGTGRIGFIEGDPKQPYYCNCIMKIKKTLTPAQSAIVAKAVKAEEKTDDPKAGV